MVAVFGSIQMAVSRVINLQHHRIAQVVASTVQDHKWCQEASGAAVEPEAGLLCSAWQLLMLPLGSLPHSAVW